MKKSIDFHRKRQLARARRHALKRRTCEHDPSHDAPTNWTDASYPMDTERTIRVEHQHYAKAVIMVHGAPVTRKAPGKQNWKPSDE